MLYYLKALYKCPGLRNELRDRQVPRHSRHFAVASRDNSRDYSSKSCSRYCIVTNIRRIAALQLLTTQLSTGGIVNNREWCTRRRPKIIATLSLECRTSVELGRREQAAIRRRPRRRPAVTFSALGPPFIPSRRRCSPSVVRHH